MPEFTNLRREITVTADVTGADPVVDSLSRKGRSWQPDWIEVTYWLADGQWVVRGAPRITGSVLLKSGEPGANRARWYGWRNEELPQWAQDFIDEHRPAT